MVVLGRVIAPFGVKGWIKIRAYSAPPDNLLESRRWWIGENAAWQPRRVEETAFQGEMLIAKLAECEDRAVAEGYRNLDIALPRSEFSPPENGEYYWVDLIGQQVTTVTGNSLGTVVGLMESAAHAILRVSGERERLIPFVAPVIREVDLAGKGIVVDWDPAA